MHRRKSSWKMSWIKEHIIELIDTIAMIAVIIGIGFFAYTHRVVEYKDFHATAVVTGTNYVPEHFETVSRIDSDGKHYLEQVWRPAVYGLRYDVTFEDAVYPYYQTVNEETYNAYRIGDTAPATFRKEWRADGSETYSIYVTGGDRSE